MRATHSFGPWSGPRYHSQCCVAFPSGSEPAPDRTTAWPSVIVAAVETSVGSAGGRLFKVTSRILPKPTFGQFSTPAVSRAITTYW